VEEAWRNKVAQANAGRKSQKKSTKMIETIRTMSGKQHGLRGDRQTIVTVGRIYRCSICGKMFTDREEADRHDRREHEIRKTSQGN